VTAGVAPEDTVAAAEVVPADEAWTSTTPEPETVDKPEYSTTATPMSALLVVAAVIVGVVPPPRVTGAAQIDISVLSEALKCVSSVYELPAESVTLAVVAPEEFHAPTSTINRSPLVTGEERATLRAPLCPCADACWTKDGPAAVAGDALASPNAVSPAATEPIIRR
jgi:hypothetical protein